MGARPGAVHAMGRSGVCVVVPWRGGCPARAAALDWCARQWPWPVVLGEVRRDEPWVKANAVRAGLDRTNAEIVVIADGDVWCPTESVVEAIDDGVASWGFPHHGIRRLTPAATVDVMLGELRPTEVSSAHLEEPPTRAHPGGGVVVLRRDVAEEIPFDRRFVGWGHEDDAYGWALEVLAGMPAEGGGRLIHLWHPPQERQSRQRGSDESYALQERYWLARTDRGVMRELVNAGR